MTDARKAQGDGGWRMMRCEGWGDWDGEWGKRVVYIDGRWKGMGGTTQSYSLLSTEFCMDTCVVGWGDKGQKEIRG